MVQIKNTEGLEKKHSYIVIIISLWSTYSRNNMAMK